MVGDAAGEMVVAAEAEGAAPARELVQTVVVEGKEWVRWGDGFGGGNCAATWCATGGGGGGDCGRSDATPMAEPPGEFCIG